MSSDSASGLNAVCGTFVGLSAVSIALRIYCRKQTKYSFLLEDWTILVAFISYVGAAACIFRMVNMRALGYSSKDLSPAETKMTAESFEKLQIAWGVLCTLCLAFIKLSILFFYCRIFCTPQRESVLRWTIFVTIGIVIAWLITFEFLVGFQCGTHFSALWNGTYKSYCTISFPYLYGLAISDFLLDIWILLVPLPPILRLHASPTKKASIGVIFLLAFIGLGASTARMVEYVNIELGGTSGIFSSDHERALSQSFYLAMLEAGMSLMAANLPTLWIFFTKGPADSFMRSVRSLLSLHSLHRSDGDSNGRPQDLGPPADVALPNIAPKTDSSSKNSSFGPHCGIESQNQGLVEVHAADIESAEAGFPQPPKDRALIRSGASQS